MERQFVKSSNLTSVGYESRNQILEIEFNDGSIYQYSNVPQNEYQGLISAASHGKYFHAHIKGHYPDSKIY
jgi:hypothetical protein